MSETRDDDEETWSKVMGVRIVSATADEVVLEITIGPEHRQVFGLVHGGVYAGLIESAASIGATIVAKARGQVPPVGLENHTSFIKAAREGTIRTIAKPVTRGRTTHVWQATVRDADDRVLATGSVRMLCAAPPT